MSAVIQQFPGTRNYLVTEGAARVHRPVGRLDRQGGVLFQHSALEFKRDRVRKYRPQAKICVSLQPASGAS